MKKLLALLLILSLALSGAALAETTYPFATEDMNGNAVTIEEQPDVVVSLTPSNRCV